MAMIDVGIKIELSSTDAPTKPVTSWIELKDCSAMPALIQPSSKIAVDFIGDKYSGELLGKQSITGLDFTFAYDGGSATDQFKKLSDIASSGKAKWMRVSYPDGTLFELAVKIEISLVAPSPSGLIEYTMSATPVRHDVGDLIMITFAGGTSPLNSAGSGN